jgi:hypothetical protein
MTKTIIDHMLQAVDEARDTKTKGKVLHELYSFHRKNDAAYGLDLSFIARFINSFRCLEEKIDNKTQGYIVLPTNVDMPSELEGEPVFRDLKHTEEVATNEAMRAGVDQIIYALVPVRIARVVTKPTVTMEDI